MTLFKNSKNLRVNKGTHFSRMVNQAKARTKFRSKATQKLDKILKQRGAKRKQLSLGSYSLTGYDEGSTKVNQDFILMGNYTVQDKTLSFYAVADGHGKHPHFKTLSIEE